MKENIAIIGGGIAGLTAGYLLNEKYDITLYEKDNRIGGNAYTYQTASGETIEIGAAGVAGPIAKNFLKLCKQAGVPMVNRLLFMSLHDIDSQRGIYPLLGLKALLAQRFGTLKELPSSIKAFRAIPLAIRLLEQDQLKNMTVGEMFGHFPELDPLGRMWFMAFMCMMSLMPYDDVWNGPAEFVVNEWKEIIAGITNPLDLLTLNMFPKNFTRSYVDKFARPFRDGIAMNTPVKSVERNNGCIVIKLHNDTEQTFNKVIFACSADQALSLLEKPTIAEKRFLGAWKYSEIKTVVHRDPSYAPKRGLCQPWTLVYTSQNGNPHFSHYYCSWLLSPATSKHSEYIATHYPAFPIKENLIDSEKSFRVPIFDFSSVATQKELPSLNGTMNTYYCGSYFGAGLHGAAVDSAIDVAMRLGVAWE